MAAGASHFDFWLDLLQVVNENGHDIAVFFPRYTLTPHEVYPTQLRQAVGALRRGLFHRVRFVREKRRAVTGCIRARSGTAL